MLAIYLFLLVVGGGLALLSFAGDLLGGGGIETEGLLGADIDIGVDTDLGVEGGWWDAFSLFTLIYGAFGAGGVGTALHLLWGGERVLLTLGLAAGAGVFCGMFASLLLSYLRRSASGDLPSEQTFEGRMASVILPLRTTTPGRIRVRRGEREHVLRALPHGTAADVGDAESWERVVVVEVRNGIAYVTPAAPELNGS
jgi:hypothetical protein